MDSRGWSGSQGGAKDIQLVRRSAAGTMAMLEEAAAALASAATAVARGLDPTIEEEKRKTALHVRRLERLLVLARVVGLGFPVVLLLLYVILQLQWVGPAASFLGGQSAIALAAFGIRQDLRAAQERQDRFLSAGAAALAELSAAGTALSAGVADFAAARTAARELFLGDNNAGH